MTPPTFSIAQARQAVEHISAGYEFGTIREAAEHGAKILKWVEANEAAVKALVTVLRAFPDAKVGK